jgi:N-acetyl-alpha-D-muramate 1-phosphate uridylyltransferase
MTLPVAILAGGLATRLRPLTERVPKSLLDVAGKPFAVRQIELLRQHGLTDIVFCVGYLGDQIEVALGDGAQYGVKLSYVSDGPQPLGTGGALRRALPLLKDAFLVLYGDSYLQCDYQAIVRAFHESGKDGLMTVFHNVSKWDRSNVIFRGGRIISYDKKAQSSQMRHIDYGLGVLKTCVVASYPAQTPLDLATIYQDLLAQNALAGFEVKHRFYEIGSVTGLEELREYFKRKTE